MTDEETFLHMQICMSEAMGLVLAIRDNAARFEELGISPVFLAQFIDIATRFDAVCPVPSPNVRLQ